MSSFLRFSGLKSRWIEALVIAANHNDNNHQACNRICDTRKRLRSKGTVKFGWHVIPSMHKDNAPRLFNYWTPDGYNSGCYNLLCLGFVQISNKVGPRAAFGLVYSENSSKHTSTQIGSDHFPGEGFRKAAYARSLEVVDQDNNLTRSYKAGDAKDVVEAVKNLEGARLHGFEAVVAAGAKEIAVFAHGDWVPIGLVYPITGMDRLLDFRALCALKPVYKANKR
ncbi:hypothetical protein Tco_1060346 [Tanacetum coccineum]